MAVIDINGVSVAIGEREIFSDVTLSIEKGQCVGLTGLNGAGKSTLMKVILGKQEYYKGTVSVAKNAKIGYLAQQHELKSNNTVYEEAKLSFAPLFAAEERMHALEEEMAHSDAKLDELGEKYEVAMSTFQDLGGYGWQSRLCGVLKGLGLNESFWDKNVQNLSGGEKTRLSLAKMLLNNNDILLLDEPTNHLDIAAAQWLTDFLSRTDATILLVSHDRYMMDKLCTGVAQIDYGKLHFYKGNYTDYCRKWEEELKVRQRLFDKQQEEIRRQKAIIERYRRFNREKSIKAAESREKKLDKMELLDAPETHDDMRLDFSCARYSGGDVFTIENISKTFGERDLFKNFSYNVKQGDRIAILGDNGAGKTTLMEIICGLKRPDSGAVIRGTNVDIGYYEQTHRELMGDDTVLDAVWQGNRKLSQTQVRSACAAMLFFGEDVFKKCRVLSGGERARCALCRLSLKKSNTLFLDEPTNHLDMDSREILEDALEHFDGTLIAVSHDRYFINRIANTLWIVKNGEITVFKGNYDDYIASQKTQTQENVPQVNKTQLAKDKAKEKAKRELDKKQRAYIRALEAEIEASEQRKAQLEEAFADPSVYLDAEKLKKMQPEYEQIKEKIEKLTEEWMENQ